MKKALAVLGGIFLLILVAAGGMFGFAAMQFSTLNGESQAYLQATLPQVLSNPTSENFLSFVASQDRGSINPAAIPQFYEFIRTNLGALKSCDDVSGGAWQNFAPSGETITAKYLATCHFSKASIQATVALNKIGGAWSLFGVHLNTDTLHKVPGRSGTNL